MTPADRSSRTAAFPGAAHHDNTRSAGVQRTVPSSLAIAADGIAERLRNLAERPRSLSVRDLIERYMAVYVGRDVALVQRLSTWQMILGDFTLEKIEVVDYHDVDQDGAVWHVLAAPWIPEMFGDRLVTARERNLRPITGPRKGGAISRGNGVSKGPAHRPAVLCVGVRVAGLFLMGGK